MEKEATVSPHSAANKYKGQQFNRLNKTEEEYRADCSKGGKAGVAARRRKKSIQETMNLVMQSDISKMRTKKVDKIVKAMVDAGFPDDEITFQAAMCFVQMKKSIEQADTEAARFCRDTSGQSPTAKVAVGSVEDFDDLDLSKLSREQLLALAAEAEE